MTWERSPKFGKPRPPTEAQEQRTVVEYLALCVPKVLFAHVPNGGYRRPAEAARLKQQGVVPGVPDILIFEDARKGPRQGTLGGIAIEMKRRRKGFYQVSPAQWDWITALCDRGWHAFVAHGADEAIAELERCGFVPRSLWTRPPGDPDQDPKD